MSSLLSTIETMDQIHVCFNLLKQELQNYYETDFAVEEKQLCLQYLTEIKEYSLSLNLEITSLINNISELLYKDINITLYNNINLFLQKTEEIFSNIYMRTISSENSYNEVYIENYFNTNYEKTAILVYILRPFIFPNLPISHTNQVEAKIIAQTLSEKGFNVDLINTKYTGEINYKKYDFMIGEGLLFEKICNNKKEQAKAVYYLTRASGYFSNMAALKRLRYFEARNNYFPSFERFSSDLLDLPTLTKINTAICLGNEHTVSTYKEIFSNIYPLNVTGFSEFPLSEITKSNNAKNFLWYGGAGAIHKGLDLCIEAFRLLPDLNLHIVGNISSEFYNFYKKDIEQGENIFYYGFLSKDSQEFQYICEECTFCLNPSCSEGQCTSVITTMFSGIIPVCTKESGIDVEKVGGYLIEDISIESLCILIRKLSNISIQELLEKQKQVSSYVINYHSKDYYHNCFSNILDDIL